jgi:hypothetical protein
MNKPVQKFVSPCGQAEIFVDNAMPIGVFHDFLMQMKGLMVDRMVKAHNEQVEQAALMKKQDPESCDEECGPSECNAPEVD